MAPRGEYAVTTVHSTQVKSPDEASILVEAGGFTPAQWYLSHAAQHDSDNGEPPRKRQKREQDSITLTHNADQADCIPLFAVNIDFHFPETTTSRSAPRAAIEADVDFTESGSLPVVPYGVELDKAGTRLRLGLPSGKGPVLILECTAIPDAVIDQLLDLARPDRLKYARTTARLKEPPATRLACTLARSRGELYTVIRLRASLSWQSGVSAFPAGAPTGRARVYPEYDTLLRAYPDDERESFDHSVPFSPSEFYSSVHVPSRDVATNDLYNDVLKSDLYPFQKRAVTWLLAREGVWADARGAIAPCTVRSTPKGDRLQYKAFSDVHGETCWVDHLQGVILRNAPDNRTLDFSGGLLAEEMGLGKTVELMALISLHKPVKIADDLIPDPLSDTLVSQSRATLIVTPPSLTEQWKSELSRHAPHLSVFHYLGIPTTQKAKKDDLSEAQVISQLCESYDVVITTYHTLAREVHFAEDPPDRSRRQARRFERKRSPLVQIQWWRICLDEAQLVESGVTSAARVARRLPRVHSWAVTGTPLKKDVQDLLGLLIFLHYKPFSENGKLWTHLLTNHRHRFARIFGEIAMRHTKAHIRDELSLPPQKRVVVTVPFSLVEQQNYSTLFDQMCEEVGLNTQGEPVTDEFNPEDPATAEAMRSWLVRLRQTCLHPQVGGRNRKALGRGTKPLRTVADVLEVMIEQNETALRVEERSHITAILQVAHIKGNNKADEHRSANAVQIYEGALRASEQLVKDARERLATAIAANPDLSRTDQIEEETNDTYVPLLGRLRNSLRTALQLQHQCAFYTATAYFQIKSNETLTEPDSDNFKRLEAKETGLYEIAKSTRREILRETNRKAEELMRVVKKLASRPFQLPKIEDLKSLGGIESRRIVEKSDELFDVIREQETSLKQWRARMAELLLKPLVDEDEGIETTGDEYEESTKQQDELYVYFDAFKTLLADLNTFVTGEDAPLTDYEAKMALKRARWKLNPDIPDDQKPEAVHAPELTVELLTVHDKFKGLRKQVGSVRGLIQETRELESAMTWNNASTRIANERTLAQQHMQALQAVLKSYLKALTSLEEDLELFRNTQNQRVEFYRQLQEVSDDVAPYKEELDDNLDEVALNSATAKEEHVSNSIAQLKTKQRFLWHLRDDNAGQSGPKTCIICTSTFEQGVLTVCGHQFCKECLSHWFSRSRSCPMCKRKIGARDVHDITFKPQVIRAQEEDQAGGSAAMQQKEEETSPSKGSLYTEIGFGIMSEVKSIDLPTSYGSKIDTLGRHLHWIREHDPGAKSIVFSQYREFLDVLGTALKDFKLGYARLGRSGAVERFRNDPSIDCLLLDAKTDSSGLTLTTATHVFICEPLIQTAVELQAIARVHRIGQTRPTTVWMYLINDTVEESIYEISVARRLAHVQSRQKRTRPEEKSRSGTPAPQIQEVALDAANSEELQSAPLTKLLVGGKGGGEHVKNDDLWQCLFGKSPRAQAGIAAEREVSRHLRASAADDRAAGEGASNERARNGLGGLYDRHDE